MRDPLAKVFPAEHCDEELGEAYQFEGAPGLVRVRRSRGEPEVSHDPYIGYAAFAYYYLGQAE